MSRSQRLSSDLTLCRTILDEALWLSLGLAPAEPGLPPYVLPLNFVCLEQSLYLHCAPKQGRKLLMLEQNPLVAFNAVSSVRICKEKSTTYYRSVCGHGQLHLMDNIAEKRMALTALAKRYATSCPDPLPDKAVLATGVLRLDIATMQAKVNLGAV